MVFHVYNNISKLGRVINKIPVKGRDLWGVYRRRRWGARAPFGHGVLVIHETV